MPPRQPQRRAAAPRRRRCPCSPWSLLIGAPRHVPIFVLGIMTAVLMSRHEGPLYQVTRGLGAVASLTEATTGAVIDLVTASGEATSTMRSWVVDAMGTSASLSAELWGGIELREVTLSTTSGFAVADAPEALRAWFGQPEGRRLLDNHSEVRSAVDDAIAGLLLGMPAVSVRRQFYDHLRTFGHYQITATAAAGGKASLSWEIAMANFTVHWSNPMWSWLDWQDPGNASQAAPIITQYLENLPRAPSPRPASFLVEAPLYEIAKWKIRSFLRRGLAFVSWQRSAPYGGANFSADSTS